MKTLLTSATLLVTTLSTPLMAKEADIQSLVNAAQKEGQVYSVGMPGSWANWKDTWNDLNKLYGLKHQDTVIKLRLIISVIKKEPYMAPFFIGKNINYFWFV